MKPGQGIQKPEWGNELIKAPGPMWRLCCWDRSGVCRFPGAAAPTGASPTLAADPSLFSPTDRLT